MRKLKKQHKPLSDLSRSLTPFDPANSQACCVGFNVDIIATLATPWSAGSQIGGYGQPRKTASSPSLSRPGGNVTGATFRWPR